MLQKLQKGQHWPHSRHWFGEHPCKISKGSGNLLKCYHVNKVSWSWPSLKGQKGQHTHLKYLQITGFKKIQSFLKMLLRWHSNLIDLVWKVWDINIIIKSIVQSIIYPSFWYETGISLMILIQSDTSSLRNRCGDYPS